MRLKITVSYDGTGFYGWQRQTGRPTIQGKIEEALKNIYGSEVAVTGSGRTDEGVHAYNQVAHFDVSEKIEPGKLVYALNFFLPGSIRVRLCEQVPDGFNARKSAKSKTYFYDMYTAPVENPFLLNRALKLPESIDIKKMKDAAGVFTGKYDFNAFHCTGSSAVSTVRTVTECFIWDAVLAGSPGYRLQISADGFLYKMVRIIAGSLIKVGEGKLIKEDLEELLFSGARWPKKVPAPSYGLYLYKAEYE